MNEADKIVKGANKVIINEKRNTLSFVKFDKGPTIKKEQYALWLKNEICKSGSDTDFKLVKVEEDDLNFKHYKYRQYYKGFPIEFGVYTIHTKNDLIIHANGECYSNIEIQPAIISNSQALKNALVVFTNTNTVENLSDKTTNLTILPFQNKFFLCYKFILYSHDPLEKYIIYVDASSGEIVYKEEQIHNADQLTSAPTKYNGSQTITTDFTAGIYTLQEVSRGGGIITKNCNHTTNFGTATNFTGTTNPWATGEDAGYDIHWGLEKTYDYYKTNFNRNSYDNSGSPIYAYAHYDNNFFNAFWDGAEMVFGDGNGNATPLTCLDVVAHEFTHAITSHSANLQYHDESGALNESFSDIFGVSIDFASGSTPNYLMGEQITGTALRDLSNPGTFNDPDTYQGANWKYPGYGDYGGVHSNSGVQNYWFYVLSEGGTGKSITDKTITGITKAKAAAIAYRNLTVYLTPNSTYADAREGAIQSAIDLFGACSNEVIQCTNAWHVVGVGEAFDTTPGINYVVDGLRCIGPGVVT